MTEGMPCGDCGAMDTTDANRPSPFNRSGRMFAGIAGLVALALTAVTITLSTIPAVTGTGAAALIDAWLNDTSAVTGVQWALTASALSYAAMIVFVAGLWRVVAEWAPGTLWSSVSGIAGALFLAGAVTSDALEWATPLVRLTAPDVPLSAGLVAATDRGWLIALVEAHVALGVLAMSMAIAGWQARTRETSVPWIIIVAAGIATLSVIPLVIFSTTQTIVIATNQVRLLWLVIAAIWLIFRRADLSHTYTPQPRNARTPRTAAPH